MGRKHWENEKLLITSNFSFPTVFSKDLYCRHIKTRVCLGKGKLPLTGTFKNSIITYPLSHNNHHILRWYEWDLLVFCKQTPFLLGF